MYIQVINGTPVGIPSEIQLNGFFPLKGWVPSRGVYHEMYFDGAVVHCRPRPMTLEEYKSFLLSLVYQESSRRFEALQSMTSNAEMTSWPLKYQEAKTYPQESPMLLTREAAIEVGGEPTQEDIERLVNRVLLKADLYFNALSRIKGIENRHQRAISLLNTPEECQDYNVEAFWDE